MGALKSELHALWAQNRDGSFATKADRLNVLLLCGEQLASGGYRLPGARSLKPKHIEHLVARWRAEDLSPGTIKNRMAALRWWAKKVNKTSILFKENEDYGIPQRLRSGENKAQRLDLVNVARISCPRMQMSLRLMAAFGLRREEALKFRPRLADAGDHIALQPSWTKGGRPRVVPVLTERQRALLDEAIALVGNDSLIPNEKSFISHRHAFQYATLKVGITNVHGLRHNYAQWRYRALTGWPCPLAGGPARRDLSAVERERDDNARLVIAEELGHGRRDVTEVYLG